MKKSKSKKIFFIVIIIIITILLLLYFYIKLSNSTSIYFDEENNKDIIKFIITKSDLSEILIVTINFILGITGLIISLKEVSKRNASYYIYAFDNSKIYNR